jgi:UDP-N-acetylmuramoylalanine--D-glutamate ligase
MSTLNDYFNYIKGKRIALIGLGVSHRPLVDFFIRHGASVTILDKNNRDYLGKYADDAESKGADFILGADYLKSLTDFDIVFRTPGMKYFTPELQDAISKGVRVTSEMETFFDLCPCKIYGVTGSDGKTTSTTIISEILKADGRTVHLGGNIGRPLLPIIEEVKDSDVAVVELSSFQLISMMKSADVGLVTNVAPNHLYMHKEMDEYIDAKKNLFIHQNENGRLIINADNDITNGFSNIAKGSVQYFSRKKILENGAYLEDGIIKYAKDGKITDVMNASDIKIPGIHNVENYLGAIATVFDDVSMESIVKVAKEFGGVEHRIEFVRELDGVRYYNDSIATSPTRTIAGLNSFDKKIIIIAGGYDKNIPYEPLAPYIVEKVKVLVLLGKTAPKIEKAVVEYKDYKEGTPVIIHADTLEEAVDMARKSAEEGDVISLSPASASFDLYRNFEERGIHFKNIVNSL